jgi:predicted RNase H-like nuclease (RuvC/YqgF family)
MIPRMAAETGTDQTQVEQLRAEVARLEREIVAQRENIDRELIRRALRIGQLEDELGRGAEFERTLSWRVTRPLRGAGAHLRRLRR